MPYSREVRLGLVLYGGVSLAIYENGVARELYRAVRGEGVYALLKDLIDSDIVVDIISGTSAGGVNGVMLGYALANDLNFSSVADLWRNDGDIEKLLRKKDDPGDLSLLDSEKFYQPRLEAALAGMTKAMATPHAIPSKINELDLFVTGTSVCGNLTTVYDDAGHAIDVKDHRGVFKLSFRGQRKNDFNPSFVPELATLARLTSCFPVAFAPVSIGKDQTNLRNWGLLKSDAVFLDGGILDNKPFSYTIDAIAGRTADCDVQRFLFYVEPDPERFQRDTSVTPPGVASAALDALINIPGYESIAGDLRSIAAHNDCVARLDEMMGCFPDSPSAGVESLEHARVSGPESSPDWLTYYRARLMQLRDRALQGILNDPGGRAFFANPAERRAARILVKSFAHSRIDTQEVLASFDVYYRLRRMFHLTYVIKDWLYDRPDRPHDKAVRARYQELWRTINHFIKIHEILQSTMETWVDRSTIGWRDLSDRFLDEEGNKREPSNQELSEVSGEMWGHIGTGFLRLLCVNGIQLPVKDSPAVRAAFHKALTERLDAAPEQPQGNLLIALDDAVAGALRDWSKDFPTNVFLGEFARFLEVDRFMFPLQFAAGSKSRDIIRVVRLSPSDAQRAKSARPLSRKVCGKVLGSFGGFFKKPWRSNDILWGRLDAVCQLIECTLTIERARQLWGGGNAPLVNTARLKNLFPKSKDSEITALHADLASLGKLSDMAFDQLLTQLVQAAQIEIIDEEWPRVIRDAMDQERTWSEYRKLPSLPPAGQLYQEQHLAWIPGKSSPDRLLVALAANAIAKDNTALFDAYDLSGRPFADEIPKPVLLELVSLVALRAERSLLASVSPPLQDRIRKLKLYRVVFGGAIPALYGWARFLRSAPDWRVTINVAILTASLVVFVAALALSIFEVKLPLTVYAVAFAAPLAVFTIWILYFGRS
jgi:predicted acylesterase/phospholipase RssA